MKIINMGKVKIRKVISLFLSVFLSTNLVIAIPRHQSLKTYNLAPKAYANTLDIALRQLVSLKQSMGSMPKFFTVVPDKIIFRKIFSKAGDIYYNNNIGITSFDERVKFVKEFFSDEGFILSENNQPYVDDWKKVGEEVNAFIKKILKNRSDYIDQNDRITPEARELLTEWENIHLSGKDINGRPFSFEQNIDFNIAVEWYLFYLGKDFEDRNNEIYALEQERLLEELYKEYLNEGKGEFQKYAFLTDIHAGNDRLFPMVAHAFEVSYEDYKDIETLEELKKVLYKHGKLDDNYNVKSEVRNKLRFKGFSDMLDRGFRYLEVHKCAVWLHQQNMLDHLSGNHEQGFANGMTKIHLAERFKDLVTVDPKTKTLKYKGVKGEHIAYWAFEMVTHSGWVTNTIDEVNEERLNDILKWLNSSFEFNFAPVNIVEVREKGPAVWLKELKKRNNVIREGDQYFSDDDNSHRGLGAMKDMNVMMEGHESSKLKDLSRDVSEVFNKNWGEVVHVFHSLDVVVPLLKDALKMLGDEITLNEALLDINEKNIGDRHQIESFLNWTFKYALGDGSLKDALEFYDRVKDRTNRIIHYKNNDSTVKDALVLINEFNQLYPLSDILEETTGYLNATFDDCMKTLKNELNPENNEKLKSELKNRILAYYDNKKENIEKSEIATRDLIKRIELQGNVPDIKIKEYKVKFKREINEIYEELKKEKAEIDNILSKDKSIEDLIEQLEFLYKEKLTLDLFNITSDFEILNNINLWDMVNYKLMDIDKYGNMYFHAMLPTENIDGKLAPVVNFRGRTGIKAVSAMQAAVRKFYSPFGSAGVLPDLKIFTEIMLDEIGDALWEVNSWYSDITSSAKAKEINPIFRLENYGHVFDNLQALGTGLNNGGKPIHDMLLLNIFMGHNPYKKREGQGGIPYASGPVVNLDDGMATGYTHTGAYALITPYGFYRHGFLSSDTKEITDMTHLALRSDAKGNGINYKELAEQGDGQIHIDARNQLKKINGRKELFKRRIVKTAEAIIFEYQGLLEYARKVNDSFLISHYENALNRINSFIVDKLEIKAVDAISISS